MTTAPRKTAKDFDPRILEIFDGYVHGTMSKREFLNRAGKYAAAGVKSDRTSENRLFHDSPKSRQRTHR